jgi:prepilin-type N-terminal cleavage/methylation domain-containing protein
MKNDSRGFSFIELVVVMALGSILFGMAIANLREYHNAAQSASFQVASLFKRARAQAIATTSAVRVRPTSTTQLVTEAADRCAATTWTEDNTGGLALSGGALMSDTTWSVCFNSRGFADQNVSFNISDATRTSSIEVMLGGSVEIE